MESTESKQFKELLRKEGRKQFWQQTGDALRQGIQTRRQLDHEPPEALLQNCSIEKHEMNGHIYYEMAPKSGTSKKHIFYLHGGAYVNKITQFHWGYLDRLVEALQCTITVPLYPLAPEHTYQDTVAFVYPLYVERCQALSCVVLMGDSAGGGLALALAQLLKEKGVKQPEHLILISPWLDVSLTNPEIDEVEPLDPFLSKAGAIEAGKMYAGDADPKNYLLSPINGDIRGLADMMILMGTDDILAPDARKFVQMAKELGISIDYAETPNMIHIFPVFTFPEAIAAFEQIVKKIKGQGSDPI